MIEDKLIKEQRIRLECLAQANTNSHYSTSEIIAQAEKFEKYVKGEVNE